MAAALTQAAPILFILAVCWWHKIPDRAMPGRWWDA